MPSCNIYYKNPRDKKRLVPFLGELRTLMAKELSDPNRQLEPDEMSLRLIRADRESLMIAPIEVEITAYSYPGRIQRQDIICRAIKEALEQKEINCFVWLKLCELGHSADN